MFHQVKVLDAEGKIKRVFSTEELSRRYWDEFNKEYGMNAPVKAHKRGRKAKKRANVEDYHFSHN